MTTWTKETTANTPWANSTSASTSWDKSTSTSTPWANETKITFLYANGTFNLVGRVFNKNEITFNASIDWENRDNVFTDYTKPSTAWADA